MEGEGNTRVEEGERRAQAELNNREATFSISWRDRGKKKRGLLSLPALERKSFSLDTLVEELCRVEPFCHYPIGEIFFHEKGEKSAQIYSQNKRRSLELGDFNQVYQRVKKSKNKIFSCRDLDKKIFKASNLIGHFFAHAYQSQDYKIIFIFSRGDFIPPNNLETSSFARYVEMLKPLVKGLFLKKKKILEGAQLSMVLHKAPFPIFIKYKKKIVFFNESCCSEYIGTPLSGFYSILLNEDYSFHYFFTEKETEAFQDFHQERINLLGELLNTLAHEFSNPLFGISLSSEILEEHLSAEGKEICREIRESVSSCDSIIKGLKDIYGNNTRRLVHEAQIIYIVKNSLRMVRSELSKVEQKFLIPGLHPALTRSYKINSTWLSQALINLLLNSAQAMQNADLPKKELLVEVYFSDYSQRLMIRVSDTGPGIGAEISAKLGREFFSTKEGGTGLGLFISKKLIREMGGEIIYSLGILGGASFTICLPEAR